MQIQISLLLDRARPETLTTQLVGQVRDAIRLGRITPGARLPSSRRLSEQLGIGRNTVVRAYETPLMECYVESRPASGIFATLPPLDLRPAPSPEVLARSQPRHRLPGTLPARPTSRLAGSPGAALVPSGPAVNRSRLSFDFAPGRPDVALFPLKAWRRLLRGCLSQSGAAGLSQPGDPFGLASLRSAIANHLASARGIVAESGQIAITSGIGEGIALAARLLLTPGSLGTAFPWNDSYGDPANLVPATHCGTTTIRAVSWNPWTSAARRKLRPHAPLTRQAAFPSWST